MHMDSDSGSSRLQKQPSIAGARPTRRLREEAPLQLAEVKARAWPKIKSTLKVTTRFSDLYHSADYDALAKLLLVYFACKLEKIAQDNYRAKGQEQGKLEIILQAIHYKTPAALQAEMQQRLVEICPLYAKILLQYSNYDRPHADTALFESFYRSLVFLCREALEAPHGQSYQTLIECDLGHVFRSSLFNTNGKREETPRLVDTLSIRELYKLRHESDQTTMNANMISTLFERPKSSPILDSFHKRSNMVRELLRPTGKAATIKKRSPSPPPLRPRTLPYAAGTHGGLEDEGEEQGGGGSVVLTPPLMAPSIAAIQVQAALRNALLRPGLKKRGDGRVESPVPIDGAAKVKGEGRDAATRHASPVKTNPTSTATTTNNNNTTAASSADPTPGTALPTIPPPTVTPPPDDPSSRLLMLGYMEAAHVEWVYRSLVNLPLIVPQTSGASIDRQRTLMPRASVVSMMDRGVE